MNRPLLIGHRGARKYAPENTIHAFFAALEHGCDGFEFDVRITADRQAVVCHDPKYKGLEIARSAFTQLYEKCRSDDELELLDSTLRTFQSRAFLNLELKTGGGEELVLAALKEFPPKKGIIVSSFLPEVLKRFRELDVDLPLGLICENRRQLAKWKDLPIQAVMLHRELVHKKQVAELKAAGKQVFVWTVNDAREMKTFAEMGVDGIISDDTKLLAKTLRPDFVA